MSKSIDKYFMKRIIFAFVLITTSFSFVYANYQYQFINDGIAFLVNLFIGIAVPISIVVSIRCPKCRFKLFWSYFNNPKSLPPEYNPFSSISCPKCNYILTKESNEQD